MTATVKVLLSEPQEFYVSRDTISGKVVLTAADSSHWFTKLSVELGCLECCDTGTLNECLDIKSFVRAGENYEALLKEAMVKGNSQIECVFTIALKNTFSPLCPPSFSLGDSSGIFWTVRARAHLERGCSKPNTHIIQDTHQLVFYPQAVTHPQVRGHLFERGRSGKENSDCVCYLDYHLPQWPERFTIWIKFNVPRIVKGKLEIYLQKTIVAMSKLEAEATAEYDLLAEVSEVEIFKAGEIIKVSCQLKKCEPAAFTSRLFHVDYAVHVDFKSSAFNFCRTISVDLAPPSPESRISRRQLPLEEEKGTCIEPPPVYSS